MSTQQNETGYTLTAATGNAAFSIQMTVSAVESGTFTDTDFLNVVTAVQAAFPAAWNLTVASGNLQVSKQQDDITTWAANMTANPPVFQ